MYLPIIIPSIIFKDEDSREGFIHNTYVPFVRADPDGRCAAMLIYGRKIVILPFKRDFGDSNRSDWDLSGPEEASYFPGSASTASAGTSKAPVLASYILDLAVIQADNKVNNIIDIQFLHGYHQPTLLILYEPLKTCPGRIAVRKDTCRLDVLTLDLKERISACIWSKEVLPFDCIAALPVPMPTGGTLVLAVNSLYYLNQGVPCYAVSLNSLGDNTMENVIKQLDGVKLTLDCARARFLTPERAVISLKGGELYVLSLLLGDHARGVRGFHFDRAAASVLTTCITLCEDHYLFLGSRLGNSLLLQFTEKDIDMSSSKKQEESSDAPVKKRLKTGDSSNDWISAASDVGELHQDKDLLEVYGSSETSSTNRKANKVASYSFEICDSLLNIGPCGQITMGEPFGLSEEFSVSTKADPDVELVTTSGHGKNGALCVLQQTIRPHVVTTFPLPNCIDMWTVIGDSDVTDGHAFLILSRAESTMILHTGEEINELDQSGFFVQGPTIYAGNIGENKYIIQITPHSVHLLNGTDLLQTLSLEDLASPIIQATSADPYVLCLSEDGQLCLLTLEETEGNSVGQLSLLRANLKSKSKMLTICAYRDTSGLFVKDIPEATQLPINSHSNEGHLSAETNDPLTKSPRQAVEDEDDLLYGDSAPSLFSGAASAFVAKGFESSSNKTSKKESKRPLWTKYLTKIDVTHWAFGLRENGNLEILSLPDFTLTYVVNNFPLMPNMLVDALISTAARAAVIKDENKPFESMNTANSLYPEGTPKVEEILVVGLGGGTNGCVGSGGGGRRPLLLARTSDHELTIYEIFPYYEPKLSNEQLKMRFRKVPHGLILRERKGKSKRTERNQIQSKNQLRHFHDIAGYEGVFVCGPYPHWLMLSGRGELRTHPMPIDGSIPCFAAFNNVNCAQGFIYFNRKSELRISALPTHLSYDAPWPVRKVPLRCTPHDVAYHMESKTYAVVTSTPAPTDKVWKFNGDDKQLFVEERDERFPHPQLDKFSIQLFSPVSWESIPGTTIPLEDWERVTSLKHLYLSSEGLHSGQRGYIVCSTAFSYGEDVTPRGYIRIYDVIDVIPEPGQPLTKNKFKALYEKEQKGPITAISSVNGNLVATVGQKIYVFQFKDKDLFGMAFIDSQVYIHQLVSLKNFILVGDIMKSVDLLQFQEDYRTLAVISRDPHQLEVYAVEYLVDGSTCAFAVTDADKNVSVFMYLPESREANGGQSLVRKADFHVGQHINSMFRIRAKLTDPSLRHTSTGARLLTGWEKRHVLWFATLDGGLGHILPCTEKTYRRLLMLQNVLVNAIPHTAGLNPKSYRTLRQRRGELINPSRGIIDGELVYKFTDLSIVQKADIAKRIGAKFQDLMDDLSELDRMAVHF